MDDILAYVIVLAVGIVIGIWAANLFHRVMIKIVLKDMGIDSNAKLKQFTEEIQEDLRKRDPEAYAALMRDIAEDREQEVVRVRLEAHQGILFAYRESDSQFLGQGNTREDLIKSMGHRFKNVTVEITNAELMKDFT
jgi:hypothetical protein